MTEVPPSADGAEAKSAPAARDTVSVAPLTFEFDAPLRDKVVVLSCDCTDPDSVFRVTGIRSRRLTIPPCPICHQRYARVEK